MNTDKWKLKQTGMFFSVFERGLFQGSDSSFSKGLFVADTNILLSFFTCKHIGYYFVNKIVFPLVFIRLVLMACKKNNQVYKNKYAEFFYNKKADNSWVPSLNYKHGD